MSILSRIPIPRTESKETTADGYRLQLGDITFLEKDVGNSSPYKALLKKLRKRWPRKGRISVFLNGPPDETLPYSQKPDQADIYRACRIGSRVTLSGKASLPEPATNPGQYDAQKAGCARHRGADLWPPQQCSHVRDCSWRPFRS